MYILSKCCGSWRLARHLKWRIMLTKGDAPYHTPAICSPNYLCGTPTVWLGLYVLWRTSCQVISRHKIAVSMRVPCTACLLVSVISLWIYVLAEMPIISPVYTCTSFLTRAEKWLEKKVEKNKGVHCKFQTALPCSIHGSTLYFHLFPALLTDVSYQSGWKQSG